MVRLFGRPGAVLLRSPRGRTARALLDEVDLPDDLSLVVLSELEIEPALDDEALHLHDLHAEALMFGDEAPVVHGRGKGFQHRLDILFEPGVVRLLLGFFEALGFRAARRIVGFRGHGGPSVFFPKNRSMPRTPSAGTATLMGGGRFQAGVTAARDALLVSVLVVMVAFTGCAATELAKSDGVVDSGTSVTIPRPRPAVPVTLPSDEGAWRETSRLLPGIIVAVARATHIAAAADASAVTILRVENLTLARAGNVLVGPGLESLAFVNETHVVAATRGGHGFLVDATDADAPRIVRRVNLPSHAAGSARVAVFPNGSIAFATEVVGGVRVTFTTPELREWRGFNVGTTGLHAIATAEDRLVIATGTEVLITPPPGDTVLVRLTPGFGERLVSSVSVHGNDLAVGFASGAHLYTFGRTGEPRFIATGAEGLDRFDAWPVVLVPGAENATRVAGFVAGARGELALFNTSGALLANTSAPATAFAFHPDGIIATDGADVVIVRPHMDAAQLEIGLRLPLGAGAWYFASTTDEGMVAAGGHGLVALSNDSAAGLGRARTLLAFPENIRAAMFDGERAAILLEMDDVHTVQMLAFRDQQWRHAGSMTVPGGGQVVIAGDRLYHMPIREGRDSRVITILDVSDVDHVTGLGAYRFEDDPEFIPNFMRIVGDRIVLPGQNGILVVNATDPAALASEGRIALRAVYDVLVNETGGFAVADDRSGTVRRLVWSPVPAVTEAIPVSHVPVNFYNGTHVLSRDAHGRAVLTPFRGDGNESFVDLRIGFTDFLGSVTRPFRSGLLAITPGNGIGYYEWSPSST